MLNGQDHRPGRLLGLHNLSDDGGSDVVWNVSHHGVLPLAHQRFQIQLKYIANHHMDILKWLDGFRQSWLEAAIELDGDNLSCPFSQRACQRSQPCPNLQHRLASGQTG
jgi:hypothetical protein